MENSIKCGSKGRTEKGRTENFRKLDSTSRPNICRKFGSKGRIEEGRTEKCWKGKGLVQRVQ